MSTGGNASKLFPLGIAQFLYFLLKFGKTACTGYATSVQLFKPLAVLHKPFRWNPANNFHKSVVPSFRNIRSTDVHNNRWPAVSPNILRSSYILDARPFLPPQFEAACSGHLSTSQSASSALEPLFSVPNTPTTTLHLFYSHLLLQWCFNSRFLTGFFLHQLPQDVTLLKLLQSVSMSS